MFCGAIRTITYRRFAQVRRCNMLRTQLVFAFASRSEERRVGAVC